jgi:putative peptidoglycan lipid II flippase
MNLVKAMGTIGGLTMVSRVLGLVREMVFTRVMGASMAGDAFQLSFLIPNLFRRLFGEGAFSAGFVPLFSQRLNSEGGIEDAEQFAQEVLAVFMPALILVTAVFMVAMPVYIGLIAPSWRGDPEKFALAVDLTTITFPYLIFISLVSLFSGVLNSLTRFVAAAFAPALLNFALVAALLLVPEGGPVTARAMAIGVIAGGVLQLGLCWGSVRAAGLKMRLRPPKLTPRVKELLILILPATMGAGIYYISQFFYAFFATSLPEGSLVLLGAADRLNQLPLAIIGSALGTAILPAISRAVDRGEDDAAARTQAQATDLAMLLTLPATIALAVAAQPIIGTIYEGGKFTGENSATAAMVLSIIVIGLPAYVLIKVLTPGFYSRKDMKTPLYIAVAMLGLGIALNFALVPVIGIAALAFTTAATSWLNALILYVILHYRGQFRIEGWLWGRLARQLLAGAIMGGCLWAIRSAFGEWFTGSTVERIVALGTLVGVGGAVYFAVAWVIGAVDREEILILLRRKKVS